MAEKNTVESQTEGNSISAMEYISKPRTRLSLVVQGYVNKEEQDKIIALLNQAHNSLEESESRKTEITIEVEK